MRPVTDGTTLMGRAGSASMTPGTVIGRMTVVSATLIN